MQRNLIVGLLAWPWLREARRLAPQHAWERVAPEPAPPWLDIERSVAMVRPRIQLQAFPVDILLELEPCPDSRTCQQTQKSTHRPDLRPRINEPGLRPADHAPATREGDSMTVYIVSRHAGAIEWMKAQLHRIEPQVIAHLQACPFRAGDIVCGVLPLNWVARICEQGARVFALDVDVTPELRGVELAREQLDQLGASLVEYCVSRSHIPLSQALASARSQ